MKTRDEIEYSPVALWTTIRLVFMLGISWGWYTCSLDTVAAFLTALLPTPVWVVLPCGFRSTSSVKTCLLLKKSLSVSRYRYFKNYTSTLKMLSFKQCNYDPCLFIHDDCIMALWVDDTIIACKTKEVAES